MWKLLKVAVSGIAIGIAFLMLGYVGIYYISGEKIFVQEIALLGQIKTLQSQLVITGISGMLIALSMYYYIEKTMTHEEKATYKIVLGVLFLTVVSIIAIMLIDTMNENIADMMIIIATTLVCAYALANSIRTLWYDVSSSINKKNNENKEKNTQEPEKGN